MTKVFTNFTEEKIKAVVSSALFEAGLATDMVSLSKAYKLLSRTYISKGIREGAIRITTKVDRNAKQLIPLSDIIKYKEKLLIEGVIKLKS